MPNEKVYFSSVPSLELFVKSNVELHVIVKPTSDSLNCCIVICKNGENHEGNFSSKTQFFIAKIIMNYCYT